MALNNNLSEHSSNSIISERVTNLSIEYSELVHCPICQNILWKPVTCNLCENSFCFQCIEKWLNEQEKQIIERIYNENENENENDYFIKSNSISRCPFNCSPFEQRKCPPLLISILSKLKIQCRNKVYGCQQILSYEQLEKHEEDLCPYQIIQCSQCKLNMFRHVFDNDQHLLNCICIQFQCNKCQSIFQGKDQHTQLNCMQKQICLLNENMDILQQKSSHIYHIQRKQIDIINQKIDVIEQIWGIDDEKQNTSSNDKWQLIMQIGFIILFILILFLYFKIFFC